MTVQQVIASNFKGKYSHMLEQLLIEQRNSTFMLRCENTSSTFCVLYDLGFYTVGAKPVAVIEANDNAEVDAIKKAWLTLTSVGDRVAVHQCCSTELNSITLCYNPEANEE